MRSSRETNKRSKLEYILSARNLHKTYDNLRVLNGINLEVKREEILAIVGKSGAGKSTLLHILGTLDHPDEGELMIENKNPFQLKNKKLSAFRNENIGFVFQFHHLLDEFTAFENVLIPSLIQKGDRSKYEKRAEELFELLGISARKTHKPSELSGGEQQRVAFARALIMQPKIVFADEPTGNLDSDTSEDLHQLILDLRKELQQTFVLVTHNYELARISDRSLTIEDGKIFKTE